MKTTFTLLLVFCTFFSLAQKLPVPVNEASGKVSFSEVVTASGADSAELYKRATLWIDDQYQYSRDRVQMYAGQPIRIKSFTSMGLNTGSFVLPMKLHYSLSILVEDGQYKYELTDISWQLYQHRFGVPEPAEIPAESFLVNSYYDSKGRPLKISKAYLKATKESISEFVSKLKEAMEKPTAIDKG